MKAEFLKDGWKLVARKSAHGFNSWDVSILGDAPSDEQKDAARALYARSLQDYQYIERIVVQARLWDEAGRP